MGTAPQSKPRKDDVLHWNGILSGGTPVLKRIVAGMLALMCVTLAFTQWGFIGLQFTNGSVAYLILMLIPVALGALLLGTSMGAGIGLFAGIILYLHSRLIPLDYYELSYVTPITSISLITLVGLIAGILFALALRSNAKGWRRTLLLVAACFAASCVFSVGFAASTMVLSSHTASLGYSYSNAQQLANAQGQITGGALTITGPIFQAIGNAIVMSLASVIGLMCAERGMRKAGTAGLRTVFGASLSAVVFAAFMLIATIAHVAITASELGSSSEIMRNEVKYLLGQMERTANQNGQMLATLLNLQTGPSQSVEKAADLTPNSLLASLIAGYTEDKDGLVVVSVDDQVIGADTDRVHTQDEPALSTVFGEDVLDAIQRSITNNSLERVVYLAPSAYNDLVDFALPGSKEYFDSLMTMQVGYLTAEEHDGLLAVMIRPSSMVFEDRDNVVGWVAFSSLVLLAAVYVLVWKLLDHMVAKHIDTTNATLERITDGDLRSRVEPQGTREFWDLAAGINVTVDALEGWIAEAESRMDAELATAKAIQESALPCVFPPYPDIQRFDIYASMNAAKEVGGDFYDFFLLGEDCGPDAGKLAFVLADVSGKGVPAALFMMKAKTQIHDYLESGMELGEAIENANRQLCEGNDGSMFVTAWIGILDYATGHIEFVNAGHNPPLLWQDGSWRWLKKKSGIPLGLFEGLPYRTFSLDCTVGDQILLYTDGVTEAFSVTDEQYGEERLERLVNEHFDMHPRELIDCVRASVAEHAKGAEQSDDITMLALEVGVPPEEKEQLVVPARVEEFGRVNDFIHAELDRRLCPVRVQNQLEIALEELFVNICNYAYEDTGNADPERRVIVTYAYSANPVSFTIDLIDNGLPFNPLARPDARKASEYDSLDELPIGGLGIYMAKKNVDELSYEHVGDSNVVTLVKRW